tara:strand:- start:825 stop:1493 length:669 start_codon:yes stop_codon:yes gene_type:complete
MNTLQRITTNYFKDKRPKKTFENFESINNLVNITITQSQSIRLGTSIEDLLRIYISHETQWTDIKPVNQKGVKERDHLFSRILEDGKIEKIYSELKSNLQLDSEKRAKTASKVKDIIDEENCYGCITALRHFSPETLDKSTNTNFYKERGVDVLTVQEYFGVLNIACPFENAEAYEAWVCSIAHGLIDADVPCEERAAAEILTEMKTLKDAGHNIDRDETDR